MVAALALFAHALPATAADYFVSPGGDNRAAGSASAPFRTIQRALGATRSPGDSVILLSGTYRPAYTPNLSNPGKDGAPITLRAAEPGKAVVDGTDMPDGSNVIAVGTHHVRIEGLVIRNAKATGLVAWGPGTRVHHVAFVDNTVSDCFQGGIYAGTPDKSDPVRDILIEGNTVSQTSLMNEARELRGRWAFGVGGGQAKNPVIRGNDVFENHGEGIGLYLSDGGLVENNTVHDNFAVNIYLDNATNTRVRRNLCYSTGNADFFRFGKPTNGIQVANETYPFGRNLSSGNVITHNLLLFNGAAFYCGAYQEGRGFRDSVFANNTCYGSARDLFMIDADPGHRAGRIEKNIFVQVGDAPLSHVPEPSGLTFRDNLWFGAAPRENLRSPSDVLADPRFVDPGGFDWTGYRLREDSPARGLGAARDLTRPSPRRGSR